MTQGQLAWYRAMEERGELVQITDARRPRPARAALAGAGTPPEAPIGYVLSLEGADSIVTLRHLERAYAQGLRAVGPGALRAGRLCAGHRTRPAVSASRGRELLREMERLGIILDVTHLCDDSFWRRARSFSRPGLGEPLQLPRARPHNRQFSDDQIRALVERGAVIGVAFDAWMMSPGWMRGRPRRRARVSRSSTVIDHIDHICQLAGNARHVGIGSDLDGAFGTEQCPSDVETIADLSKLPGLLVQRGYSEQDVEQIAHGNFVRFLQSAWSSTAA